PIHVEGFTDDTPISTAQFPSNWELSSARAAATVRLLESAGVDPARMAAVGYAASQPQFSNRTVEGKRLNRRVVLVISRDETVRRILTASGSNQMSSDSVSAIIEAHEAEQLNNDAIEQITTPSGGVIFKRSELQDP
ncbi:MAG: OmpA family protein, partial [Pontibacterium sp.]